MINKDILKYRAFHKLTKELFNVYYYTDTKVFKDKDTCFEIEECIIEQCTGIKDKNGKLIYEGDIINFGSPMFIYIKRRDEEHRRDNYWIVGVTKDLNNPDNHFLYNEWLGKDYTILGNIHQNVELLDIKEDYGIKDKDSIQRDIDEEHFMFLDNYIKYGHILGKNGEEKEPNWMKNCVGENNEQGQDIN